MTVRDTGIGMEADVQRLIFEPFFTTKERGLGAGLGLSAARSIVRSAGGEITAVSDPEGGTSLHAYLPFSRRDSSPLPSKVSQQIHEQAVTILVVDDEPVALQFVTGVLTRTGYAVLQAENGQEALDLIEQHGEPIDLLVTDIVMSPINGPELVGRLAATQPDLPVVYVSGYPGDWLSLQGSLSEEETFLEKPFDSRTLRRVVGAMLARHRRDGE